MGAEFSGAEAAGMFIFVFRCDIAKKHMMSAHVESPGHAFCARLSDRATRILNCFMRVSIEINRNSNGSVDLGKSSILYPRQGVTIGSRTPPC